MNSDVPLDYALFQLSPGRTRCELFVSREGKTEKLASGLIKPFVSHLKILKEQASRAVLSIKLEVGRKKNAVTWFSKGTLERFVRFVSTPEVLELVNTLDEEMSELEGARKIYSLGAGDQFADEREIKSAAAADATKKELLRAIDVRLIALKQDLATAAARTAAAGFSIQSASELLYFADQFGAVRLSEACNKFLALHQRRPELISHEHSLLSEDITPQWKNFVDDNDRSSSGSDMSIDQPESTGLVRLTDCHEAQMCGLSNHQLQKAVGEPIAFISEQLKPDPLEKVEKIENQASSASSAEPVSRAGGGSRRLSVQDRINLFECKQKEQSSNSKIASGSSGGTILSKLPGAKGEHRRNPSEVSVEKSVLRRWSGACDMSIDLNINSNSNNDQKESASTTGTGTLSANSHQIGSRNADVETNVLIESTKCYSLPCSNSSIATTAVLSSSQYKDRKFPRGETQNKDSTYKDSIMSISVEPPGLILEKKHAGHASNSLDRLREGSQHDQIVFHSGTKGFSNSRVGVGSKVPATCPTNSSSVSEELVKKEIVSQISSRAPALALSTETNQPSFFTQQTNQKELNGVSEKTQATYAPKFKVQTRKREDSVDKFKDALDTQIQLKDSISMVKDASANAGSARPQTLDITSFEEQEANHTDLAAPQVPVKDVSSEIKQVSASEKLRFPGKTSDTSQRMFQGRRDGIVPIEGRSAPKFINSKFKGGMETSPSFYLEESHTARLNKGNHELNDVLQMKADELERLFAEHKLRIQGDQVASTQRSKTSDDHANKSIEHIPVQSPTKKIAEKNLPRNVSSNVVELDSDLLLRIDGNFNFSSTKMKKILNSKGKLYDKYMQKRDAKLREECESKRAQKEAKMKAMHDSLEHSQAEMKARFAGLSGGQNLTHAHWRAEKMRSFNSHSTPKSKDQTSEILTGDGDDGEEELSESSAGNQTKRFLPNKILPSSSQTSVSPTPRQSVKSSNSGSLGRRVQSENPVTQSIANFSDFKNENIKPTMIVSKVTTRGQLRSVTRSKNSIEDAETVKEDGSCWSNSMRKSSANPQQLKDLSSLNSKENLNKVQISGELKQYLKKGNGAHHGHGAVMVKLRTSTTPEELKNKEKSEDIVSRHDDLTDIVNDDEDMDEAFSDGDNLVIDLPNHCDSRSRPSKKCEEPQTENCKVGTFFHGGDSTMNSSKFDSRNTQDFLEGSSESWNSLVHPSLPFTQEASDIDASVDSLTDGPASWNSHLLNQMMDSEAARMRKKWGNAQIPVIAAGSYHQSRRDVTKGIKRLLKFGRKNRGTDYLVNDWVSASTASEGDDDPEDGRDYVLHPSDDLRKSRMGYTITSYDGFDEGSIFPEQTQFLPNSIPNPPANFRLGDDHVSESSTKAPRSFFSLSSFRSKASHSKPR